MRLLLVAALLSGCASLCPDGYQDEYACVDVSFPIP
ncbi:hypothetical protein OJF2_50660 [Aquisphaera giovannonii]|uniref:Uncharacterized protein n=1 Tax=Aquisphaera giovannonii TaxID=406548 RepID=A0A5B9W731_9BACT|nr:hypothetical protein OJF2_50660 [Aquisphaera giovannonii]